MKSIQAQYFQRGPDAKISDAADREKLMMNPALWTRSSWSLTLMDPEGVHVVITYLASPAEDGGTDQEGTICNQLLLV